MKSKHKTYEKITENHTKTFYCKRWKKCGCSYINNCGIIIVLLLWGHTASDFSIGDNSISASTSTVYFPIYSFVRIFWSDQSSRRFCDIWTVIKQLKWWKVSLLYWIQTKLNKMLSDLLFANSSWVRLWQQSNPNYISLCICGTVVKCILPPSLSCSLTWL